jgi:hypothetical protein
MRVVLRLGGSPNPEKMVLQDSRGKGLPGSGAVYAAVPASLSAILPSNSKV